MSIALDFQKRIVREKEKQANAARMAEASFETLEATASDYQAFQQLLDALELDIQRMSGLPVDDKLKLKREELVPKYTEYVDKYIEAGEVYQNPVMTNLVIWLFDLDDIERALNYGFIAVEQMQPAPERFKRRDFSTIFADMTIEWCKRQLLKAHSIQPYFDRVFEKLKADKWPMPDALKAKFYVIAGDICFDSQQNREALAYYLRAVELDQRGTKRKTNIDKLQAKLRVQEEINSNAEAQTDE